MKQLYFMRHGLSVMNKQGVFSGSRDTPLAPEGIQQCEMAAEYLKNIKLDVIVASPLRRTIDSASIIARKLGIPPDKLILSDLFRERSFGPLEGTSYSRHHDLDDIDGVEHSSDLIKRAEQGIAFLNSLEGADVILLVSHGAIGRALRHALNPKLDYHEPESFNNAEIVRLI